MGRINLDIPDLLHKRLKGFKKIAGTSVNDYCYKAIARQALKDGILTITDIIAASEDIEKKGDEKDDT